MEKYSISTELRNLVVSRGHYLHTAAHIRTLNNSSKLIAIHNPAGRAASYTEECDSYLLSNFDIKNMLETLSNPTYNKLENNVLRTAVVNYSNQRCIVKVAREGGSGVIVGEEVLVLRKSGRNTLIVQTITGETEVESSQVEPVETIDIDTKLNQLKLELQSLIAKMDSSDYQFVSAGGWLIKIK